MGTPLPRVGTDMTQQQNELNKYNSSVGEMIEVKTTPNNYKIGKNTINSRIGDDFDPEKPMINFQHNGGQ